MPGIIANVSRLPLTKTMLKVPLNKYASSDDEYKTKNASKGLCAIITGEGQYSLVSRSLIRKRMPWNFRSYGLFLL